MTSSTLRIPIWDADDSPGTKEAYKDDHIDAVHFFALKSNVKDHQQHRKPKKDVL
jgi:hypothetical protein